MKQPTYPITYMTWLILHSEATEGVMDLQQNCLGGFEGSFCQICQILRYEKPYFQSYIIEIINFQPSIFAQKMQFSLLKHH